MREPPQTVEGMNGTSCTSVDRGYHHRGQRKRCSTYTSSTLLFLLFHAITSPLVHSFLSSPTRSSFQISVATFRDIKTVVLCASEDNAVNEVIAVGDDRDENDSKMDENDSKIDEDESEDDDIITQRLRRNAEAGPINPIKEHAKMVKENKDEAHTVNTTTDMNGNSTTAAALSMLYSQMLANSIDDPEFDPNLSTDEQYLESQFKELLSRKGETLSRLGPGIAALPLEQSSNEAKSEEELAKLEGALQQVIEEAKSSSKEKWDEESSKKQTEILGRAHELQREIDQLHIDDCGAVLLCNLGFYEAFSLQDAEAMRNVWWNSPSVICIHPSHPPLIGSNAVLLSFTQIFENGMKGGGVRVGGVGIAAASGGVFMTPTNFRGLSVRGTTASLVCDEEVYSKGSAGESSSRVLVNKLLTTNVFRKIGGKWMMTHRHASWHPESVASKAALKAEPGVVLYDDNESKPIPDTNNNRKAVPLILRKTNGDGTSRRPKGLPAIPPSLKGLDAKAVLGIPLPPKKEEPKKPKKAGDGIISKIINLSDLFGGGGTDDDDEGDDEDDDDEDEDDKGIGDALADMLRGSSESDSTQTTGSGTTDDPFITRRVIKVGPDGIQDLFGKKRKKPSSEEDDDEEEGKPNGAVIDLSGKSKEERKQILAKFMDNVLRDAGLSTSEREDQAIKFSAIDASVSTSSSSSADEKDDLRQKCIATLRKLSESGQLSPAQKRVLFTDIITSSARGESSMVETAYELLCTGSGVGENEVGLEDFTEQCRVFATAYEQEK